MHSPRTSERPGWRPRPGRWASDRGAVTVEAAWAVGSLVVVLALALAALSAVAAQLRCMDAAREAARLTARGEQPRAVEVATRIAPEGAQVDVQVREDEVTVDVSTDMTGGLPGLDVRASAVAVLEPGVGEPAAPTTPAPTTPAPVITTPTITTPGR